MNKRKELYDKHSKIIRDMITAEFGQGLSGVCRDIYFTVLKTQKMYDLYESNGFTQVESQEIDALLDTRLAYLDLARFVVDAMVILARYDEAVNDNDDDNPSGWGFSLSFPTFCSDTITMVDYLDEYRDHILPGNKKIPDYCFDVREEYLALLDSVDDEDDENT